MKLVVDTHLHIYPFYDIPRALIALFDNLEKIDSTAIKVACLTERYDCNIYNELKHSPAESITSNFEILPSNTGGSLEIRQYESSQSLILLPGQQIITSENLEVLSLNCANRIEEGADAETTINEIDAHHGIPVIAWGLGKWFGHRGKIVESLINKFKPNQLAVGDTTMRPLGWRTPQLISMARDKGFKVLCGSDPLPFSGEEIRPGSYASTITFDNTANDLSETFRSLLTQTSEIRDAGKRGSPLQVAQRTLCHRRESQRSRE